ncbi:MAG: hypothetical protein IKV61_03985 [Clostridia bacterium]|nr:hypothetical protein [Clostridia bacterium]
MADKETRFRSDSLNLLNEEIVAEQQQREKEKISKAREQSKIDFRIKQEQLLNQLIELEQEYGEDYYLVEMLSTFYEVSVEMENVMKSMESVNMAMECITEALSFLDSTIQFDQKLMEQSNRQSYSFIARFRLRMQMRRTRKNNIGRMKAMVDGLMFKYRMMDDMVKSLKKFALTMSKSFKKVGKKKKGAANVGPTEAQKRIAQRKAELGVANNATITESTGTDSSGNYDDVL